MGVGWLIAPGEEAVIIGIALCSTALGTILPILRDAGELRTPFGLAASAIGAVGEFGPLIAISIFLGGREPGISTIVLAGFAAIAGLAIWLAFRVPRGAMHRVRQREPAHLGAVRDPRDPAHPRRPASR